MHKPFRFNTSELPRRAGEMREYQLEINLEQPIGIDVIEVPSGKLRLNLRIESVDEGVLASGKFETSAKGECIRCLDPISIPISKSFQELYAYKSERDAKHKNENKNENRTEDQDDELLMDGDFIDLENPIRDAIVLSLPINPLCDESCEGLCPQCGEKWRELPEDHSHDQIDARWSALKGLLGESEGEK